MTSTDAHLPGNGKFEALRALAATLSGVSDLDVMMETILSEACRFVGAEAGSIYLPDGDKLILAYSRNAFFAPNNQAQALAGNSLAAYVAREAQPLNIAEAYDIPPDKPYRFEPFLDRRTGYVSHSVLTLPLIDLHHKVLGVLQIINRQGGDGQTLPFDRSDEESMLIFSATASMALERVQLIRQMLLWTVRMAELRDPRETTDHALRVGHIAGLLYENWAAAHNLPTAEIKTKVDRLRLAAMLHDIGKVGVPDQVLNNPGRLTPDERQEMEKHVLIGLKLFEPVGSDLDAMIHEVILSHHERWDGQGYPGWVDPATGRPLSGYKASGGRIPGKKGEEISIFGRVTAVADVFDALSSKRVYKEAFDEDVVSQIMLQESGHHFDPELVDILMANLGQVQSLRQRFPQ